MGIYITLSNKIEEFIQIKDIKCELKLNVYLYLI